MRLEGNYKSHLLDKYKCISYLDISNVYYNDWATISSVWVDKVMVPEE